MTDVDAELRSVFRDEATESLDELTQVLQQVPGADPKELRSLLQSAFRIMHNVKGAARVTGLSEIELVAHALEEQLSRCRSDNEAPSDIVMAQLRRGITLILQAADSQPVEEQLLGLVDEVSTGHAPAPAPLAPSPEAAEGPVTAEQPQAARDLRATVRVETERLDRMMGFSGEFLAQHARHSSRHSTLATFFDDFQEACSQLPRENIQAFQSITRRLETMVQHDRHELQRFGYLTTEFGTAIKSMRMQPMANSAAQWRRTVAEIAQELGKAARCDVQVGDIEIDRQILDGLRDPMMHLLRNAVDHGLESSSMRESSGKPIEGTIQIHARSAGSMVEIIVSDDGRGINLAQITERAVEMGMLGIKQAQTLSREELMSLLFAPGFSTALSVSRVSGRGVGLDVVRERVTHLGGRVEISTEPLLGGTSFVLTVPASVVSTKGLLVRLGVTTYALPITHVGRSLRIPASEVRTVDGSAAAPQGNGQPLKLRWLSTLMQTTRAMDPAQLVVVVLKHGNARLGLVVEEVVGEAEFVSKRLPWNIRRCSGVAGAVILGNGSLAVVLDVPQLFSTAFGTADTVRETVNVTRTTRQSRILVVDDSLTSRTLERNVLSSAGYEVITAVDGEEGWSTLRREQVDLVVTDIEMPRLDGIQLTKRIRGDAKLKALPIILVTSMDRPEDLAAGSAAGADEYIVKGRFDQRKLLDSVARLL